MGIEDRYADSPTWGEIPRDHRERYRLAAGLIPDGAWVLDAACGTGYGSWIMAELARPVMVIGVERSPQAIAYGLRHYAHPQVALMRADVLKLDLGGQKFDVIAGFDALERITDGRAFLAKLRGLLAPGGTLVISAPNEDVMPLDPRDHPDHVRRYRSAEFARLLADAGFGLIAAYTQLDPVEGDITPGFGGAFHIAICTDTGILGAARMAAATADARW